MSKRELLVKSTFTFSVVASLVGLSLLIIFNNPIGLLIEFIALVILFVVLVWFLQEVSQMKLTEKQKNCQLHNKSFTGQPLEEVVTGEGTALRIEEDAKK